MKKEKAVTLNIPAGDGGSMAAGNLPSTENASVNAFDRWLVRRIFSVLRNPPIYVVLWNGEQITRSITPPVARVMIHDRKALYKVVLHPNLHFGDLYSSGHIDIEGDLLAFLEDYSRARRPASEMSALRHNLIALVKRARSNTLSRSRHNIHHHYDIGNDFYKLWLDKGYMQYTCAYYPNPSMTLKQAQIAKLEHICRKLRLEPGDTVVEAGCGWGGLARYMAKHYGVKIRSYNISHQQILYAREKARAEGLENLVEYIEDDYRNITGEYDVFVSIGMLEHVGQEHFHHLGKIIDSCLKDNGRGLIHSIGRNRPAQMNAWIDKRIFPGAYPPSIREMLNILEPWNFAVLDVENLRLHYAKTLLHWLERYERHADKMKQMYDINFYRAWRLYLTGSIAAFSTSELQLFQILFTRFQNNELPWSRAHLYQ